MHSAVRFALGVLAALVLAACQRSVPEGADTPPGAYPGAQAAGPTSRPAAGPPSGAMPPGHPPTGQVPAGHPPGGQMPPGHPPSTDPGAAAAGGDPVRGTLTLAAGQAPKAGDVLFVMARKVTDSGPGPLVAVIQARDVTADSFPYAYELGPQNVMMQGVPFAGPFRVYARLDRDGDPMTKTAEDLYAEAEGAIDNGAEGLDLVLAPKEGAAP